MAGIIMLYTLISYSASIHKFLIDMEAVILPMNKRSFSSDPSMYAKAPSGKGHKNIILNVLLIFFIALMIFSAVMLSVMYMKYRKCGRFYDSMVSDYVSVNDGAGTGDLSSGIDETNGGSGADEGSQDDTSAEKNDPKGTGSANEPDRRIYGPMTGEKLPVNVDFKRLQELNGDIVGWLYCPDTTINYPVVQGNDNNKYLHILFDGRYGVSGTIFMDYRNESDLTDTNTIIYGHHMKDGSMFRGISDYKEAGYYRKHKYFYFLTPDVSYRLAVLGGYTTESTSDSYTRVFSSDYGVKDFLRMIKTNSDFKTDVDIYEMSHVITLSTCAYDFKDARYVLHLGY